MARREERIKAITLRRQGMSYSQIKEKLGISKSTLSGWLSDMPLSNDRLYELQKNEQVIEKIRFAKQLKREKRQAGVLAKVTADVGVLTEREILIAGLFLYWAEGGKRTPCRITLSNTDPSMIRFYLEWIKVLNIPYTQMYVRLHLYSDMDVRKETAFWTKEIGVRANCFKKPYIKESKFSDVQFSTFGHGTCNVTFTGRDIEEYVTQGLRCISSLD